MSNILDIPQIPNTAIELLQNDLHMGFVGDVARRVQKARWVDEQQTTKTFPARVDTFATLTIFPEKQAKAQVMQSVMQKYKIDPDGGISIDKKALKVGGLCLALDGTPV